MKLYSLITSTQIYRKFSAHRKESSTRKLARKEFEELFLYKPPKGAVFELLSFLFILGIGILLFTQSIFFVAVVSDSMAPAFWRGDMLLAESVTNDYKTGDIIVFTNPKARDELVVHRIHSIEGESIRTKGDNQNQVDDWVITPKEIRGKALLVNSKPIVFKKIGKYFIENLDPLSEDPTYSAVRNMIRNVHAYGIFYILAIILIIMLSYVNPAVEKIY